MKCSEGCLKSQNSPFGLILTAGHAWSQLVTSNHSWYHGQIGFYAEFQYINSWSHVVTLGHIFEIHGLWRPYGPIFRSNSASTISLELVGRDDKTDNYCTVGLMVTSGHSWSHVVTLGHIFGIHGLW